jgi:hypothetical protein
MDCRSIASTFMAGLKTGSSAARPLGLVLCGVRVLDERLGMGFRQDDHGPFHRILAGQSYLQEVGSLSISPTNVRRRDYPLQVRS